VIELVRAGEIGEPWGITVTRLGGGWGGWSQPWRNSLEQSGGLLMEVNAHEIDFMCQIGGDVQRVYAEADKYGEDPSDYPNLCFVSMRFKSGAVGMLHSSTVSAVGDLSGKIQGSKGSLIYTNGFGKGGEIRFAQRDQPASEATVIPIAEIEVEQPVRKELRLFVEAVLNGTPPPIPGREGKRNVVIAEAAYESARTGQPVTLE
jgi:predicted dehydrogenase